MPENKEMCITGNAGHIQVLLSYPKNFASNASLGIICHPHPLYGGSLQNKVVHMINAGFNALGMATLRFNFRGVGESEGVFDEGIGETEDVLLLIEWFLRQHPGHTLCLAGFSFGSYVVTRVVHTLMEQKKADKTDSLLLQKVVLVAPPLNVFSFQPQMPKLMDWMVIQGGKDEIVNPSEVTQWVQQQAYPPKYIYLDDADHFFHSKVRYIRECIIQHWENTN